MSHDHFPDRQAFMRLPPFQPFGPSCSTWPECGCDEECEADRKRIERLLRQPILGSVEIILLAAIVTLAAFALFGV